jgi:tripeptide aminopeptidase
MSRLLDRFLRYVRIDTTADEHAATYPSSPGQLELGKLLLQELRDMGLADARQDEHGLVLATLPATVQHAAPTIALCSHLDTSPETTGKNVRPQVIENYRGGDITLPGDTSRVIRVAENPELKDLVGKTLVTTDGTTLLGADDKAGLAVIMEAAERLLERLDVAHGPIKLCLTCDEEIGHGVDHVDLAALGATACYTLDGPGRDVIDVETFSADLAVVTARGVNIHPSIGKDRMVNSIRAAAAFVERLPKRELAPEVTAGRQGFIHPYVVEGGVAEVKLRIILRDFETPALARYADLLRAAAASAEAAVPGSRIEVAITPQYRNMREGLAKEPRAVALAVEAHRRLGRAAKCEIIRGGTDGSRLTELGLPTPNLSTGEHNPHSPLEWTCLEEMEAAVDVLVELARVWGEEGNAEFGMRNAE